MRNLAKFLIPLLFIPQVCFGAASTDFNATTTKSVTSYSTHNSAITYCSWYISDGAGEGGLGRFIEKREAGTQVELLTMSSGLGAVELSRNFSGGVAFWRITKPSDSVWHHLCFTYDSSSATNDPVFYLEGASATITTDSNSTGTANTNTDKYVIGNRGDQTRTFDGRIVFTALYSSAISSVLINEIRFKPEMAPSNLLFLQDFDTSVDMSGRGVTFTNTSTSASSDGPPVMFGGGLPL